MQTIQMILLVAAVITTITINIQDTFADRNNNRHDGNNGQCRKLQSTLPPELQDYQGCHDSFSGNEHNDDHDNNGDENNGIGHGNGEENGNGHNKDDGGGGEEPPPPDPLPE